MEKHKFVTVTAMGINSVAESWDFKDALECGREDFARLSAVGGAVLLRICSDGIHEVIASNPFTAGDYL